MATNVDDTYIQIVIQNIIQHRYNIVIILIFDLVKTNVKLFYTLFQEDTILPDTNHGINGLRIFAFLNIVTTRAKHFQINFNI